MATTLSHTTHPIFVGLHVESKTAITSTVVRALKEKEAQRGDIVYQLATHSAQTHTRNVARKDYIGEQNWLANTSFGRMHSALTSFFDIEIYTTIFFSISIFDLDFHTFALDLR